MNPLIIIFILFSIGFLVLFAFTAMIIVKYMKIMDFERTVKSNKFNQVNPNLGQGKTVFTGDSITEGFLVEGYFPGNNVVNRGISGDTTPELLNRLESNVISLKPSKIFMMIGTNDLYHNFSLESTINNIEKIVSLIHEQVPECKTYIWSIPPIGDTRELFKPPISLGIRKFLNLTQERNEDIVKINQHIQNNQESMGITYIDTNGMLRDDKGFLKKELTIEGLHLNASGYNLVAERLAPFLE